MLLMDGVACPDITERLLNGRLRIKSNKQTDGVDPLLDLHFAKGTHVKHEH